MTIKFKVFYQFRNEGKLISVYRLDDKILLSINDDTAKDLFIKWYVENRAD